jgi:hypothetical protein
VCSSDLGGREGGEILPGNTARFREASARLGYPLMNAIPGLVDRIDDLDRWLEDAARNTGRLEEQLAETQKEVRRLNAVVKANELHIKALVIQSAAQK